MEDNLTPEQVNELKNQLALTKKELEETRQKQQLVVQSNPQDKFIETLFDKGGQMLIEYSKMSAETQKYTVDKQTEIDKEELIVINKLDTKEKIYKGSLIGLCVIALVLSALFIPKAEVVIPVLSLIIGLLFKSSSLSDFFTHSKNKNKETTED